MLTQVERIPAELGALVSDENATGFREIALVIDLPDDWNIRFRQRSIVSHGAGAFYDTEL